MKITIDITDELEFWNSQNRPDVSGVEEWVALLEEKLETIELARCLLPAHELGEVQEGLLSSPKLRLLSGTRAEIYDRISRHKIEAETSSGKRVQLRTYWGRPREDSEEEHEEEKRTEAHHGDPAILDVRDPRMKERSERYLYNTVPGHIYPRLVTIDLHGGDPIEAAKKLSAIVFRMAHDIKGVEQPAIEDMSSRLEMPAEKAEAVA